MMMNKPKEARKIYESILRNKDFAWAKIGLARALMASKDYSDIELLLNQTLQKIIVISKPMIY